MVEVTHDLEPTPLTPAPAAVEGSAPPAPVEESSNLHHEAPAEAAPEAAPVAHEAAPVAHEAPEEAPEESAAVLEEESSPSPLVAASPEDEGPVKNWYVVKVQSGREDTIKDAIERRVRKDNLEASFGQIVIPVEKISEVKVDKHGKKVTRNKERKLYPGYLMVNVAYDDRILYLFRETSGVGDFVGAHPGEPQRAPTPMAEKEIQRILGGPAQDAPESDVPPPPKGLSVGTQVRVVDGPFIGMDGVVKVVLDTAAKVQVELSVWGRPVPVDFEYYQIEQV